MIPRATRVHNWERRIGRDIPPRPLSPVQAMTSERGAPQSVTASTHSPVRVASERGEGPDVCRRGKDIRAFTNAQVLA
jgi:hypothetical protein